MTQMFSDLVTMPSDALSVRPLRDDPRADMHRRLPRVLQPFLTWLTAKPAPGEIVRERKPLRFVTGALVLCAAGILLSALALHLSWPLAVPLLPLGLLLTASGLGLFQVVVFHHCSHGTVFRSRRRNRDVGRLISALLLFKHFDAYQREHMLHHSANKLFTDEDEFTDFVIGICDLAPGLDKRSLWRKVIGNCLSPAFHARFFVKRLRGSLASPDRAHNLVGSGVYVALFTAAFATGHMLELMIAWLLPLSVLLQIATIFRILCEHRLPAVEVIERRGKAFVCLATAGVFPGKALPARRASSVAGFVAWTAWWLNMLTVQLFVRLFVLVGDAPCHDFHHRRPATKRWTSYIQARQADADAGSPGFPANYIETWGLFRAVDENLAAMALAPRHVFETR